MRKPGNMRKREIIIIYLIFGIPSVIFRGMVRSYKPAGPITVPYQPMLGNIVLDGIFLWVVVFILFYPWFREAK